MKVCSKCKESLPFTLFYKRSSRPSGLSSQCKKCSNEATRLSRVKRRKSDPEFVQRERENSKRWTQENPDKYREYQRGYSASRKALKLRATPPWLTEDMKEETRTLYKQSGKDKSTEVDHIVPLKNPNVCGLHVPWNLRVISAEENRKKSNAYDDWGSIHTDSTVKQLR